MYKIIDVHVHLQTKSSHLDMPKEAQVSLDLMDRNGIDHAIVFPKVGFGDPEGIKDMAQMHDMIVRVAENHSDRFLRVLAQVEPRYGNAGLDEVDRVFTELGVAGLMFHNDFFGTPIKSERMYNLVQRASKYPDAVIALHTAIHSFLEPPFMAMDLIKSFPQMSFIMIHPMMNRTHFLATAQVAKECPNVCVDTCMATNHDFVIEEAVELIGADRILFGTDNPSFREIGYCPDKHIIEAALISEADKERIFSENAKRLFKLDI